MRLSAGARLGPYEILAPLGAGGMGEVYRARDTKLNRDTAIKVLPEAVAADRQRLARLQREAQVLAAPRKPVPAIAAPAPVASSVAPVAVVPPPNAAPPSPPPPPKDPRLEPAPMQRNIDYAPPPTR
mgnify:CR=1 FL=1